MPIPTYTPGYPPDGSSLGQTKSVIRNNLDGTFETLGIDHVNNNGVPGSNPAGYHTIIHEVSQTSVNTVSGVNQVFSGVPGTLVVNAVTTPAIPPGGDTQLYSLTGNGGLTQLTGGFATTNGYAWMGGFLVQWGTVTSAVKNGSGTTSVNLPISYPKNFFGIVGSLSAGTSSSTLTVSQNGLNELQYYINSNSSQTLNFTWVAIGN